MLRALFRLVLATAGAALAAIAVAMLEVRAVGAGMAAEAQGEASTSSLFFGELGVLLPMVLAIGGMIGFACIILEPGEPRTPREYLAALRGGPTLDRLRAAAVAPLVVFATFFWTVGTAYAGRAALAEGKPPEAGLTVGVASIGLMIVMLATMSAILPTARRLVAGASDSVPQLRDPLLTGGAALAVVLLLFAIGIVTGDTGGEGGLLGIFGVLKRDELDLRPVANALLMAIGAYGAQVALGRMRFASPEGDKQGHHFEAGPLVTMAAANGMVLLFAILCYRASDSLGDDPAAARGLERHAPLGHVSLALLRRLTDHDHDGYSASFGGGDCNDKDPKTNPGALDVPGNSLDEDCSGNDTPVAVVDAGPKLAAADAGPPKKGAVKRSYNVILFTVDTLRIDLGFMGYDKRVSPNLDKLAETSTVFERAYSMASYTGKSVGPLLIGRYPSETLRDGGHFNTYFPPNVFVTERLHDRGVRTFAGHCHWYFKFPTGLNQGMEVWDTSAIPPGMGDNDSSVTSERESDLALKLLGKPENTSPGATPDDTDGGLELADAAVATPVDGGAGDPERRFFGWFHYFDPHAQYVPHEGAPETDSIFPSKKLYDGEVWFTDKHLGRVIDYVESQPWGKDTVIILTADHGEAFADHNMSWHGQEIWESLVRVPLLVHVPGEAPRRIPLKRSHIDLVPTILDLMGVDQPDDGSLDGKSLLPDIESKSDDELEERDVYIDMPPGPYNGPRRAVITGPTPGMKLIHQGGGTYLLFDLANDPKEARDLSFDKEKLADARSHMDAIRSRLKEVEVKPDAP